MSLGKSYCHMFGHRNIILKALDWQQSGAAERICLRCRAREILSLPLPIRRKIESPLKEFVVALGLVLTLTSTTFAFDVPALQLPSGPREHYTIQPQVPDIVPGDGILDSGSWANPFILKGADGSRYEIKPEVYDLFPNDGILDGGSFSNPWTIKPTD